MPPLSPPVAAARRSVVLAFLQQGWIVGGWALQIPLLKARLGISETTIGVLIVGFGIGSLLTMLSLGPVIARVGSRAVTWAGALISAGFLVAVAHVPNVEWAFAVATLAGAAIGACDLGMNAQGVEVEKRAGRPLMSAFHGWWSVGTLIGALASGPVITAIGGSAHSIWFSVVALALAAACVSGLLDDSADQGSTAGVPFSVPRVPAVWALAAIVLFAYVVEGAAIDWSALYVTQEIAAPVAWGGVALAGLQVTMATMRFVGDRVRSRIGDSRIVVWGGVVAAAGYGIAGLSGFALDGLPPEARAAGVAIGFTLSGLGLANIVPVALTAAGAITGVPRGIAMSIVTGFGYAGLLLAPSALGFAAEISRFAFVFLGLAVLPLLAALIARRVL